MATYTALLKEEKDGRWSVELEEEPRVHSWGKTIVQALERVREAAAMWFETEEDLIDLVPKVALAQGVMRTVGQARRARGHALEADRVALEKMKAAADALAAKGLSVRDAAVILGISHQRVHQLLHEEANHPVHA